MVSKTQENVDNSLGRRIHVHKIVYCQSKRNIYKCTFLKVHFFFDLFNPYGRASLPDKSLTLFYEERQ
jgi:hypothetical protein